MKLRLLIGLSLIAANLGASSAHAERYLVQFRSEKSFQKIEDALKEGFRRETGRRNALGRINFGGVRLLGSEARALQALPNLRMAVVEATAEEAAQLNNSSDLNLVEKEFFYPSPTLPLSLRSKRPKRVLEKELTWGLKAIHAPEAWSATKFMGDDVKVVVLDTGIDKDHPDLKKRFAAGKNFVQVADEEEEDDGGEDEDRSGSVLGFAFLKNALRGLPLADTYDYFDQIGHGTHVAGTIAAEWDDEGVVGVAPKARIYMGRVCGKFGCSSISIVKGVEWAIEQGAGVLSMSLGGPLHSRAQQTALDAAQAADVFNVAASGNSGTDKVSFPAAYDSVMAVGAIDNTLKRASFSQYGPELAIVAPGVDVKSTVPMGTGRESLVKIGTDDEMTLVTSTSFVGSEESTEPLVRNLKFAGLGKTEEFMGSYKGSIALIQRGTLTFAEKVKNAIVAGADGVLIYNNAPGLVSGALTQDGSSVGITVAMIEQEAGEKLAQVLSAGFEVQASIETLRTDYAAFQGTSMATPHVAGVAALVRSVNKTLLPAEVKDLLMATATKVSEGSETNEYGAGVVNAEAAAKEALAMKRRR